jgi:hypothetical protein
VLYYSSEKEAGRLQFLQKLLKRLEEEGWQTKLDTGWKDHDVEIYGQRWARLRLTTAAETLPRQTVIRCRLQANWSLRAKLTFWTLLGAELVAVALLRDIEPWLWMILLAMPLTGWFLEQEKHNLQAMIALEINAVADELHMATLKSGKPPDQPVPA